MTKNNNINILTFCIVILIIVLNGCTKQVKNPEVFLMPNMPYPIAKEPALITSAGQGPEGLIIAKMSDKLKIVNKYRYKADKDDLQGMSCLIIVEGISSQGLKAVFTNLQEDEARIERLLLEAKVKKIPVVVVFPGGKVRRTKADDKLAEKLAADAHYVIALREADEDYFFSQLSKKYGCKLTLKQTLGEIPVPLNSVFR